MQTGLGQPGGSAQLDPNGLILQPELPVPVHGPALISLFHLDGNLFNTRGVPASFARTGLAADPVSMALIQTNTPRYYAAKWGKGLYLEDPTTNLILNSDFETITGTAVVFKDPMTAYTGTIGAGQTFGPWTTASGSVTGSASGVTSGAASTLITAGNPVWKSIAKNGGDILLTMQATFTTPSTFTTSVVGGVVRLQIDANNYYHAWINSGNFLLSKCVGGTVTQIGSQAVTLSASHTYTIQFIVSTTGQTVYLFDGAGTGGTKLATINTNDTSLSGGYIMGVGGDTNVVITNPQVTAPFPDAWTIGGDQRVAWGVTNNPISGNYSVSGVGVGSGVLASCYKNVTGVPASTAYSISGSLNTQNIGASGAWFEIDWENGATYISATQTAKVTGTTSTQRVNATGTSPAGTTNANALCVMNDAGTAVFDAVQLEQKAWATTYSRNDSATTTTARSLEQMSLPGSLFPLSGSFSAYVNLNRLDSSFSNRIFSYGDNTNGIHVSVDGATSKLKLNVINGGTATPVYDTTAVATGTWYHIALTWTNGSINLYKNGALVATASVTLPTVASGKVLEFGYYDVTNEALVGILDEPALFNRVLTTQEILQIANSTQPILDVMAKPVAPDTVSYNEVNSSPDANGTYTITNYYRDDGTLYMSSTLSGGPDSFGNYSTATWKYYDETGTVLERTVAWALKYDSNGKLTSRVKS